MKTKKGFTLIELIVVIAIIGVLAALLVPLMIGYVAKAKKKSDVSSAKLISQNVIDVFAEDNDDLVDSFYAANNTKYQVTENSETYDLVVVCTMNGNKDGGSTDYIWNTSVTACDDFVDALNEEMEYSGNAPVVKIPIKYKGSKPANKWIVGYRDNNPNTIEIWVGDTCGQGDAQPSYRLWSAVSHEYNSAH